MLLVILILLVATIISLSSINDMKKKTMFIGITLVFTIFFWRFNVMSCLIFYITMICIGIVSKIKQNENKQQYESSLGLRISCLLIPLVGLIVYAVNIVQNPKIAKECGEWALAGFLIGIVLSVTSICIVMYI